MRDKRLSGDALLVLLLLFDVAWQEGRTRPPGYVSAPVTLAKARETTAAVVPSPDQPCSLRLHPAVGHNRACLAYRISGVRLGGSSGGSWHIAAGAVRRRSGQPQARCDPNGNECGTACRPRSFTRSCKRSWRPPYSYRSCIYFKQLQLQKRSMLSAVAVKAHTIV